MKDNEKRNRGLTLLGDRPTDSRRRQDIVAPRMQAFEFVEVERKRDFGMLNVKVFDSLADRRRDLLV